ncbi:MULTISPECIES: hypothetical protein [unclassified Niallia]|uniref:hypothetical protein n=1 Tax=unclassified Niallia TaxID=2837522 RepID=UPI0020403034|nr:hypothetical protein [Niallia sp. MER 6]MCM3030385.1 hypothetical protein [Niallia sp. MER 6]
MDVLAKIYNALIADAFIAEQASRRIKYYEYPESGNVEEPYIIIDPLDVPEPSDFADDTWLTYDCLYQIEVWTKNRTTTRQIGERVHQVLWKLGFRQNGGLSEYDSGIFREARRFRGKLYREDFDTIAVSVSLNKEE